MAQVRDVVCGMTVDSDTAQHHSQYKGQTYYFCASGCKTTFDKFDKVDPVVKTGK